MGRRRHFFRHGELHLVLLALLRRRPGHGYQLLETLDALFGAGYRPSAGSVYPALGALEEEGLIEPTDEGDRRVYTVTAVGEQALRDRTRTLASIEARTGVDLSSGSVEPLLSRFSTRVRSAADHIDRAELEGALEDAARRIERLAEHGAGAVHDREGEAT